MRKTDGAAARMFAPALAALLFFAPAARAALPAEDFAAIFGDKYAKAEKYLEENRGFAEFLALPEEEAKLALAVVFPEILRFSALEDVIQVRALKVLYVQYGEKYANFSVGHFQMKPTFAVQLERDSNRLLSAEEKAAAGVGVFDLADISPNREKRVLRLDDARWQARYLGLFMRVMAKRHAKAVFADALDRLRYYATAFNAGYTRNEKSIRRLIPAKSFHTEIVFSETKYCYADVAVFYYDRAGRLNRR